MILEGDHYLAAVSETLRCRFEAAVQAADAVGINVRITSGYRSPQEQANLRNRYLSCLAEERARMDPRTSSPDDAERRCREKGIYPAATPGDSAHEKGYALDAVPVCTPAFAAHYDAQFSGGRGVGGPTAGGTVGSGELGPLALDCRAINSMSDDPTRISGNPLWETWRAILRQHSLETPFGNDRVHVEPCELRGLIAAGRV